MGVSETIARSDPLGLPAEVTRWAGVLSTSVLVTYLSQGLHNCQIAMQADQSLGYLSTLKTVFGRHGPMALIRGAEARVGLLLVVNALNELLLKRAWED